MSKIKQISKLRKMTIKNGSTINEEHIAKSMMFKLQDTTEEYKHYNDRDYKHLNNERLCYCCDTLQPKEEIIHKLGFSNHSRGYGSSFDNESLEIQLCSSCYKDEYAKWFDEIPEIEEGDFYEDYKYEKDITDFINSFILENQEYVLNGAGDFTMDRQDWIDMENNILPDGKYKEYRMYSPSEAKSYEEKFPTCHYPVNRIYSDDSKGCWCPFGACGNIGQTTSPNISDECYYCDYYKVRETPIKDIEDNDFEDYKLYIQSKLRQDELNSKFD